MRDTVLLFTSLKEPVDALTDEQAGQLFKAILAYQTGEAVSLDGLLNVVFLQIKQQLDYNNDKYNEMCKKRSDAGKKGMQSRWNKADNIDNNDITNDNNVKSVITTDNKHNHNENDNVNVNVNDNVNDNDNENEKVNDIKPKKRQKKPAVTREVYFPNDELLDKAFRDYVNMRIEIKKPFVTDEAIDKAMDKLKTLSGGNNDVAIQICNESVMNSWQGLFAIKSGDSGQPQSLRDKWMNA